MNLHITKSKNAESFHIARSYVKADGRTSFMIVRKLGTLNLLLAEHGPTEGLNNKIKVLKRTSYGIRNFQRLRTRIFLVTN